MGAQDRLAEYRKGVETFGAKYDLAKAQIKEEVVAAGKAKEQVKAANEARAILQEVASQVQHRAQARIAGLVSRCLKAVFGEEAYGFVIRLEKKRGKVEANLVFKRNGLELTDPKHESGVGQIEVAAFALRLAAVMFTTPQRRRLLVLDEPFRCVNGEVYQRRLGRLIDALAKELDFQFVVVSDRDWMKVGKVVKL